jgi:hypothetical protein
MTILVSKATYQGYEAYALRFPRSSGFQPDFGSVRLRVEDLNGLKIAPRAVPWRAANGIELDGATSVTAMLKAASRLTVTAPPALGKPQGGLFNFGELVLTTTGHEAYTPVTYRDIFVHSGGITEVDDDLDAARAHATGLIDIPITDIRWFYREYGCYVGRINYRLRGNRFDNTSVNLSNGNLFTFKEVLTALFLMLPGSPIVLGQSEVFQLKVLPPPTDIESEGEPVVQTLQRLLDKYGLTPQLQPDNNYLVSYKLSKNVAYGFFASKPAERKPVTFYPDSYQKKTVWTNVRPPAAMVLGERIIQRITLNYVPVIKAEDGRWYKLYDYLTMIGYTLGNFLAEVLAGHEKNFEDVPPTFGAPADDPFSKFLPEYLKNVKAGWSGKIVPNADLAVHARRVEAFRRYGFKAYAPEILFTKPKGFPDGAIIAMTDRDFERVPWLPLLQAPMYTQEIKNIGAVMPPAYPEAGDLDTFSMEGPLVWARSIGQHFVSDLSAGEDYIKALQANVTQTNSMLLEVLGAKKSAQESVAKQLDLIKKKVAATMKGTEGVTVEIDADVAILKASGAGADQHADMIVSLGSDAAEVNRYALRLADEIKQLKAQVTGNNLAMVAMKTVFDKYRKEYLQLGSVQVQKANRPYGLIQGGYSLDPTTGIITFANPTCWMRQPWLLDGDTGIAQLDGGVVVMAGYERKTNQITDWTAPIFAPENKDVNPKVLFVGVSQSTVIKCPTIRSRGLQLYCTDEGTPMNLGEVVKDAQALVEGQLKVDRVVEGFRYDTPGFITAVLDGGTQSIQYTYDGDEAMSYINVNGPNMPMPLGPNFRPDVPTQSAQTRETIGTREGE